MTDCHSQNGIWVSHSKKSVHTHVIPRHCGMEWDQWSHSHDPWSMIIDIACSCVRTWQHKAISTPHALISNTFCHQHARLQRATRTKGDVISSIKYIPSLERGRPSPPSSYHNTFPNLFQDLECETENFSMTRHVAIYLIQLLLILKS